MPHAFVEKMFFERTKTKLDEKLKWLTKKTDGTLAKYKRQK